jgi:hypothetical protein
MRSAPRKWTSGLSALVLLTLFALLTGCARAGSTRAPQPTDTPSVATIVTRTASADSPAGSDHHLTVSASFRPGEQLLGGGYILDDVFESDYSLIAAYPATDHTWTVSADSGSSYQLQALAYCLVGSPSLGIQALQAATCPTGMTLLSEGGRDTPSFSGANGAPYVLCAARGVTQTAHGIRVGALELDCAHAATGNDQSESRSFSYTCAMTPAAS